MVTVGLLSSGTTIGGRLVEWALASLGAMVLAGIIGISICALTKVLRYSKSVKGMHFKAVPISKEEKRLIMEHIDELFKTDREQSQEMLS